MLCRLMEAVSKQIEHLNQEIAALNIRVKNAEDAFLSAEPAQQANLKEVWLRLCKLREFLEQERAVLTHKMGSHGNI